MFILSLPLTARSQLCNGSLGDPVAMITFGSGSSGSPLPPGKTNYDFVGGCPNDGSYTITNLSFGCFDGTWLTVVGDHTPDDAGGFYMMVNASNTPGVFYVDTIKNLCGNTFYEFSAYIMNVLKSSSCGGNGIQPDLTFSIETVTGTVINTYNTGKIPARAEPLWSQYGTYINTPAGITSLVIRITNNAPGGCGNDIALDDIALRPCGPKINAGINGLTQTDTIFCENTDQNFVLEASYTSGYTNPRVQWQLSNDNGRTWTNIPGATTTIYARPRTGSGYYSYRMIIGDGGNIEVPQCRIASKPINFTVNSAANAFIQATNYVFSCYGSTVNLFASGGTKYEWTGPNGFTSNLQDPKIPNVQFFNAGMYIVKGTTFNGCGVGYDTTNLDIYPAARLNVIPGPLNVCEGLEIQLGSSGGNRYKWEPRATLNNDTIPNPVARPLESTTYKVIMFNEYNCWDTGNVYVNVYKLPVANAGPDIKMLRGRPAQLLSSVTGTNTNFRWTPVTDMINPTAIRPSVNPPSDMLYRLEVTSNVGCGTSSDETLVRVFETVKVPNTFTPNGDGYNDVWEIDLLPIFDNCVLEVYNTAGQLVYRTIGYSKPWDGTRNGSPLPAGTYYYAIDLKVPNANRLSGYITIIR
jgi:gliding motility-associated-like protein